MSRSEQQAVVKKNFAYILKDDLATCERMSAVLDEAAKFAAPALVRMLREGRFSAEALRREPPMSLQDLPASFFDETPPENRPLAMARLSAAKGAYFAAYASRLTAALTDARLRPSPSMFVARTGHTAPMRVAVPETDAFRRATQIFAAHSEDFDALPMRSFADACDAVVDGDCAYCILPLENSRDGFLSTTLRMMTDNDLFVARVCETADAAGVVTRFALLCHEGDAPADAAGALQVALRMSPGDTASLAWLFTAMETLGVTLVRTASQPLAYTDGYAQLCTFGGTREALFAWLLLLALSQQNGILLGVYDTVTSA